MTDLNTATLERLRGLNVSALATCLFKRGFHNTSMNGIVPVSPTASRMVGPAFTLRLIPSREDRRGDRQAPACAGLRRLARTAVRTPAPVQRGPLLLDSRTRLLRRGTRSGGCSPR